MNMSIKQYYLMKLEFKLKDYCILTRKEKINHTHGKETNGHRDDKCYFLM